MSWQVNVRTRIGTLDLDVDLRGDRAPAALVGPNGSGKTTVLRLIAGAGRAREGTIRISDRTLFDTARHIDLPPEQRCVGYVPQGYRLFPHLRVVDNVAFSLSTSSAKGSRAARRRAAVALLGELRCAHLAGRMPAELSGGEQQRVALARALITEPQMLLLDEPLAAMDASARRSLRGLLAARLRSSATPTLVATHDVRDLVALDAWIHVLENGRIVQHGTVADLRRSPATDFVAELVGA